MQRRFGPQKGADPAMIQQMDQWLSSYAALAGKAFRKRIPRMQEPGLPAVLGLLFSPFPCHSGIRCKHHSGRNTSFRLYKNADIVITGEGCLDGQTVMGKAPVGVAKIAREFQKPVLAFSGCVTEDAKACHAAGIDAFFRLCGALFRLKMPCRPTMQNRI